MGKKTSPFLLGRTLFEDTFFRFPLSVQESSHHLTIGCSGSGKMTTGVGPAMGTFSGDAFVLDPKGEHTRRWFFRRQPRREGARTTRYHFPDGRAGILDPFGVLRELPSMTLDPQAEFNIDDDRARSYLSAESDAWVLAEGPRNQHFTEMARLYIEGVIAYHMSHVPAELRTLPNVFDLLLGVDPVLGVADPERVEQLLIDMRTNNVAGGIAQLAAAKIGEMGENERGSVMSTVARSIKWMSDPAMRRSLARSSDLRLSDLGRGEGGPVTIFVVLPFAYMTMATQARWMRTLINLVVTLLQSRPGGAERTVLLVLDEFAQIAETGMETIAKGVVTLRDANVKVWPLVQSITQLKASFGPAWETFVSSSTTQLSGIRDLETAEWAARMLGKHQAMSGREPRTGAGAAAAPRELMTPAELLEEYAKDKPKQLVFAPNGLPMRLERLAYKPLVVNGQRFNAWPLAGHYEDVV